MERRAKRVVIVIAILLTILSTRLFYIQVMNHSKYVALRNEQALSRDTVTKPRSTIYAKTGEAIAISKDVYSIYAVPESIKDAETTASSLASLLNLKYDDVLSDLRKVHKDKDGITKFAKFVWIKRKISDHEASIIKNAKMDGIGLTKEPKRFYPYNKSMSSLVGIVDIDDKGLDGIERRAEKYLSNVDSNANSQSVAFIRTDGKKRRMPDLLGSEDDDSGVDNLHGDVYLTINMTVQQIVEDELDIAFNKWHPKSISCVAMNPFTGEIIAMSNRPNFDPNNINAYPVSNRRNIVITDPYEPGSAMKPFIASAAIEEGICTPDMVFNCENGSFKVGRRTIHDHHPYGNLSFRDVIAKSSNVGAVKIGLMVGDERMHRYLSAFGFGSKTGIDLSGEANGKLYSLEKWSSYTLTSVPIGHEISVTPLQIATGYSAIANGGVLMKPYVVSEVKRQDVFGEENNGISHIVNKPQPQRRVISERTSAIMRNILTDVVENGTGSKAKIKGLKYAGKTGTTIKVDSATGSYSKGRYISSFVAFAPTENARICIAVIVNEPKGGYYGGDVAAPIVSNIINRSIISLKN